MAKKLNDFQRLMQGIPKAKQIARPVSYVPPGWRLTTAPSGTRRAINPQGENVSYGQYLNAQARQGGFKSHSDYRKYAKQVKLFRTKPEGKRLLRLGSPQLKTLKETTLTPGANPSHAPGGRLAQLLEDIGWRSKGATYPVGDTATGGR